jgi:predicted secreted hydrolase
MSGELEVTGELRRQFAEENEAALKREGLNPDRVEVWEDGYRTKDIENGFEWWYFDAQLDDGSTLVTVFTTKPLTKPKGPMDPAILIIYKDAAGKRETFSDHYDPAGLSSARESCDVRIGPSWAKGDLETYQLHAEAEGFAADLSAKRKSPSWRPGAAFNYLDEAKTKYFAWVVPMPYGEVEGTLSRNGKTWKAKGSMYHDHNWGNATVGSLLDHWYWGRARIEDYTLIFAMMTTIKIFGRGGIKLPVLFLAKGDEILTDDSLPLRLETQGDVKGPGGQSYPTSLDWRWKTEEGSMEILLRNPRLMVDLDLAADLPGWAKPFIHLIANPYYYDFDSDLELSVDLNGVKDKVQGRCVFEKMMFR